MKRGTLDFVSITDNFDLVAEPVEKMIERRGLDEVYVSEIDPDISDTAAFCEQYEIGKGISANCVVIQAKTAERVWYVACVILATGRVDVNGVVRKYLAARKTSFAPMDKAVTMTAMEYGGITPIGLPADWPILVDDAVIHSEQVIIGSGVRKSKLLVPGRLLGMLPGAVVLDITQKV